MPGDLRIRLEVAYDGTGFSGWAKQPGRRTCQELLEDALAVVYRTPITVTVAGRTDAGVHALGQVVHADVPSGGPDLPHLPRRLNSLMRADDIVVLTAANAPDGFDARFSAVWRRYRYRLQVGAPNPLAQDAVYWHRPLDEAAMMRAAESFVGMHDFAAFCKPREGATTIRELREFRWSASVPDGPGRLLEARLVADAFCHSMVRSLVGACVAVGEGRLGLADAEALLRERKRSNRFPLMPPGGLTLLEVGYPEVSQLAEQAARARRRRTIDDVTRAPLYDAY